MPSHYPPGSIITARNRLWRVEEVGDNLLRASTVDGGSKRQQEFFLPLEKIAQATFSNPDSSIIGDPAIQKLLIRAYQFSLMHGTAPFLSVQQSRVIPKNFQLTPLLLSLEQRNVRLLIADDVGMGKSIEAGLIIKELLSRNRASRILVVTPAGLREQWEELLKYFFHINAKIISSRRSRELEKQLPAGVSPWEYYDQLIASIDYIKPPRKKAQLLQADWDIVIVDEAHIAAKPHQTTESQTIKQLRHDLIKDLSQKAKHLILLTATPHNGYHDSFASLLKMVDPDIVSGPIHNPVIDTTLALHHVVQRTRKDLEEWFKAHDQESPFPERNAQENIIDPSDAELKVYEDLEAFKSLLMESAAGSSKDESLASWTIMHYIRRAISSPLALRKSLGNRLKIIRDAIKNEEKSIKAQTVSDSQALVFDQEISESSSEEDVSDLIDSSIFGELEQLRKEEALLEQMLNVARSITPAKDSKFSLLYKKLLTEVLNKPGPQRIIIFTKFVDTLKYLEKELATKYRGPKYFVIYGKHDEVERKEILKKFGSSNKAILIATDAISEGLNLQYYANKLIHYELPWNPNKLEQRNGRIDRFGQEESEVFIHSLVMNQTADAIILQKLIRKSDAIKQAFGFAPPFFSEDKNILKVLDEQGIDISPQAKQLSLLDPVYNEVQKTDFEIYDDSTMQRIKSESFYGQSHLSLSEVEQNLQKTHVILGSPNEIQQFVISSLKRVGCTVSHDGDFYKVKANGTDVLQGSDRMTITFKPNLGLSHPDVEYLDLSHPVVNNLINFIKQEAFATSAQTYGRTSIYATSDVSHVTAVFTVVARYAAGNSTDVAEELLYAAIDTFENSIIDPSRSRELLFTTPKNTNLTEQEKQKHLQDSLELFKPHINDILDQRKNELKEERLKLQAKVKDQLGQLPEWLQGFADLELVSHEIITQTILLPWHQ